MILIVKRILLFVLIASLYLCIRPESHALADNHEGYDDSGNVDVLSDAFINAYLYNFSQYDFANVKRGMTVDEVNQLFNANVEKVDRAIENDTEEYRVNDIVITVDENEVESIYIEPQSEITKDEVLEAYNTPSGERNSSELERGAYALEYKMLPSSNFKVLVVFDDNDHVLYITHTLDRSTSVVTVENANTFIERGLQLNKLSAENYTFESPTTTDDGEIRVAFHEGEQPGYLLIAPNGVLDIYTEDDTLISTVNVPFYGN